MSDTKNLSQKFSRLVYSVKRKNNKKNIPDRTNGDQYYYIHEFEQADEKTCIQYDKRNEEIYQKNLKLYNHINKKLINTPFNIDNKPSPPKRPSNYERLDLWKKRNVKISAHNQSLAILYLMANNINIKLDDSSNGVEPFEAVNIAEQISIDNNENMSNIVKSFLYNNFKNNIVNKYKKEDVYNIEYPIEIVQNNLSITELNLNNFNSVSNLDNNNINKLTCSNPEHHNIDDKINYYNRNSLYPTIPIDNSTSFPPPSAPPSAPPPSPPQSLSDVSNNTPPSYRTNSSDSYLNTNTNTSN
jgi:hypothetical protein